MNVTPLIEQYKRIKDAYKDCILLFRIGDFYETLYDDAKTASKVLGIALTKKQKGVPLAGVPHHAVESYIAKLVKSGYKVAICEQMEEPKPGKLVDREVVEVITKGTLVDDNLLDTNRNNYLAAICPGSDKYGFAFVDLSTGEFKVTELTKQELIEELKRVEPAEILVPDSYDMDVIDMDIGYPITKREEYEFTQEFAERELKEHFNVAGLQGFGCEDMKYGIGAAGEILVYIKETKKTQISHIRKLIPYSVHQYMIIDPPTRKNLELIEKIGLPGRGQGKETLLWALDWTKTPMGARLLRNFLLSPLLDIKTINCRLELVEEFVNQSPLISDIRNKLEHIPDIERLIARISLGRGNARDLVSLKNALKIIPEIEGIIKSSPKFHDYKFPKFEELSRTISKAIIDNPPPTLKEGGIIKTGFDRNLDELRNLSTNAKKWIMNFERSERERTGINSLKVRFNNVFGYYIEVTKPNLTLVPDDYIRKQTITNAERFITEELKDYESKVLSAEQKIKALEYELFCQIREEVSRHTADIQDVAQQIAEVDVFASFAFISKKSNYIRPIVDKGKEIIIKGGRHPVVERLLAQGTFVPNSTTLNNEEEIYIITGPNMSGKSTYLRQVGLITLMAQMGCFVPAEYAKIGVRDRIFTRIGASDDLTRGVSTFLAEMNETANIINNAGEKSLVLLDEIGRGTSTFDGMSIAWAVIEYIAKEIKCKTLFATHYHELTELAHSFPKVKNYNICVKKYKDRIIFLRQLRPGSSDDSYGIDVARLAGLPDKIIEKARAILDSLETRERQMQHQRAKSKQTILNFKL